MRPQPQTYCSLPCAGKYRPKRKRHCEVCQAQYKPTFAGQRTCGRSCGAELQRINGSKPPRRWPMSAVHYGDCIKCGDLFVAKLPFTIRCTLCRASANRVQPPAEHTCKWCGETFTSCWTREKPMGRRRTYCGDRCSKRAGRAARDVSQHGQFKVSPRVRKAIYVADGHCCHLCDLPVRLDVRRGHLWSPTLDHVVPRSAGGSDARSNLRTAHLWCNSMRGVQAVADARALVVGGPPTSPASSVSAA